MGHVLHNKTGLIDGIKIQSSTNTVFSISDAYWYTDEKLGLLLHLNPSVDEFQIIDAKTGNLLNSYDGSLFTKIAQDDRPIYCGLRPGGTPMSTPEYLFVGDDEVAALLPGETILSNILPVKGSGAQLIAYFIINKDKITHLASVTINLKNLAVVTVERKQPPKKINQTFPVWNLSLDEKGNILAE